MLLKADHPNREGACYVRRVGGDRDVTLYAGWYNFTLALSMYGSGEMLRSWEFLTWRPALRAALLWDPSVDPEPFGWYREPATGRRRVPIFDRDGFIVGRFEYVHR